MAVSESKSAAKPTAASAPLAVTNNKADLNSQYSAMEEAAKKEVLANRESNKIRASRDNSLYIINGVEYPSKSLFGKNPTSPYAPSYNFV